MRLSSRTGSALFVEEFRVEVLSLPLTFETFATWMWELRKTDIKYNFLLLLGDSHINDIFDEAMYLSRTGLAVRLSFFRVENSSKTEAKVISETMTAVIVL